MRPLCIRWWGLGLLLGCGLALGAGPAWSAKASVQAEGKAQSTAKTPGSRLPSSVRFIDAPSNEKPAARERRLKRECKGRPNAGMCLGYTR